MRNRRMFKRGFSEEVLIQIVIWKKSGAREVSREFIIRKRPCVRMRIHAQRTANNLPQSPAAPRATWKDLKL
jgi:hypothetical protein